MIALLSGPSSGYLSWGSQNAVHELGHLFDWRAGRGRPAADLQAEWNVNPNFPRRSPNNAQWRGYAGPRFTWQQSSDQSASEEFADMFLGWAYNQWERSAAGATRSQWMTTNMAGWITLITGGAR